MVSNDLEFRREEFKWKKQKFMIVTTLIVCLLGFASILLMGYDYLSFGSDRDMRDMREMRNELRMLRELTW